ncbi:MAG: hypothetical protein LUD51_05035 [Clostridia bacterium]|nr:hypothetical protein [Clostridia bacterium]
MYYVIGEDGSLNEYTQAGDRKSKAASPANGTYSICTGLSELLHLACVPLDGTIDGVKNCMLARGLTSSCDITDSMLKVSGSKFTLTYSAEGTLSSESLTVSYKSGKRGLDEMKYSYEYVYSRENYSMVMTTSGTTGISYSYSSGMMPESFGDFT